MYLNAKVHTYSADGFRLDYVSFGTGDMPLVLIPGLSLNRVRQAAFPLAFMYRKFAAKYTVYVFDRPEEIPVGYTIQDAARDTAVVMRTLGLFGAHVLGVSQGGMIAQYLAAEYPELVGKLVLGVTLSRPNDRVTEVITNWIRMFDDRDHRTFAEDMLLKMYSEKYIRRYKWLLPILTKYNMPKDQKATERFQNLAAACLTCNMYDRLEEIRCPVFVIGGRTDQIVTASASEEIAEKLQCALHIYEELGHAAYEEAKDFNDRVFAFLQS